MDFLIGLLLLGISTAVVFGLYRLINGTLPSNASRISAGLCLLAMSPFFILGESYWLRGIESASILNAFFIIWISFLGAMPLGLAKAGELFLKFFSDI